MKTVFSILAIIFCYGLVSAQEPASGKPYPYRIVHAAENFPVGNHIFRTDDEYLNQVNKHYGKLRVSEPFFSPDETGIVLSRAFTSGSYRFSLEGIEEKDNRIIIYTKVITPKGKRTCDMLSINSFIAIRKTSQEIIVKELTE